MDLVHDRGSMDPVHILMEPVHGAGPWSRSMEPVHVLYFPVRQRVANFGTVGTAIFTEHLSIFLSLFSALLYLLKYLLFTNFKIMVVCVLQENN